MKARPILFSAPMVRALLAGTKTQTRRVCKPAHDEALCEIVGPFDDETGTCLFGDAEGDVKFACPYGAPGDRLWVREAWRTAKSLDAQSPAAIGDMCIDAGYRKPWAPLVYEADGHRNSEWRGFEMSGDAEPGKTRVSIHMPRWASRILLYVLSVRVEQLQDISDQDALAEGVSPDMGLRWQSGDDTPRGMYGELWESINGPGSWDTNPWVWVVEFKRIQT